VEVLVNLSTIASILHPCTTVLADIIYYELSEQDVEARATVPTEHSAYYKTTESLSFARCNLLCFQLPIKQFEYLSIEIKHRKECLIVEVKKISKEICILTVLLHCMRDF